MADVEPLAGRVGEHVEHVELRPRGIDLGAERALLQPAALPSALDRLRVIRHGAGACRSAPPRASWIRLEGWCAAGAGGAEWSAGRTRGTRVSAGSAREAVRRQA